MQLPFSTFPRVAPTYIGTILAVVASGGVHAKDSPVTLEATYVGDVWSAVDGGSSADAVYIQQVDVGVTLDLEDAIDWQGATLYIQGSYNDGSEFSPLAGDAQVISNIEAGTDAVRLYEAWLEQQLGERTSIKLGLIDLNTEFDVLDHAGLYINSAHGVGSVLGLSGENGPSIFPVTGLAARIEHRFANDWTVRVGVFDGVPGDPNRPRATVIDLGGGDGALVAAELQAPLADGKLLFGHWRYTAEFETFDGEIDDGNAGWYVRAEHWLSRFEGGDERGLAGFFRLGMGEGSINPFDKFASAGLTAYGPIAARPQDQAGIAVATAFASDDYRRITGASGAETVIELTYSAQLTDWLRLQPDLQYVINPAADPTITDVLACGMRVEFSFGF